MSEAALTLDMDVWRPRDNPWLIAVIVAGFALSAGGLVLLFAMPIVGQLTSKVQASYLIAFGWLCLAIAMFYSTKRIDLQISFIAATWLRIAQVVGLGFCLCPFHSWPTSGYHRRRTMPSPGSSTSCAIWEVVSEPPWSRR